MYVEHQKRKSINLWIKPKVLQPSSNATKRPRAAATPEDESTPKRRSSGYDNHLQKMDEIEEILQKLRSKHGKDEKYTPEQFHCWANLIQMKKHDSYEAPPNKPFFGVKQSSSQSVTSPGKRIELRTHCIDQLTKWHKLLEDGIISKDEYEDMHKTIMNDIRKF
uniref:Uncharacterized protein n=1 Tax=Amphimedon queenslandica TaxID=400682 RepID=A0A1X7SGI6_AMPQE